ncbi:MAG: hypothetical protein IJE21_03935 [Alistipes sp.]|nr:hypothetical protein [Alistipes sp.]
MDFRHLKQEDIDQLVKYNERVFPERRGFVDRYFTFLFAKNKDEQYLSLVIDDASRIRGQIIYSSMSYFYQGTKTNSFWSFDLIVDESLRKEVYGLDFMQYYSRQYKSTFATGSGPVALKLHLALGSKWMGEIRKYVGIFNVWGVPTSVCRGVVPVCKFPNMIVVGETYFVRCVADEVEWAEHPYNEELWEPCRDNEYMRWRFSNKLHEYAIYKDANSDNYFVLRTIVKKGITAVVLVDFRCNLQQKHELSAILQAIKKIMRKMWLAILICGSSHANIDKQLERAYMKSIGRPRPIIGKMHYKDRKSDIDNRQFALVTLADSDGETLW